MNIGEADEDARNPVGGVRGKHATTNCLLDGAPGREEAERPNREL
jgi:hypothetical protein